MKTVLSTKLLDLDQKQLFLNLGVNFIEKELIKIKFLDVKIDFAKISKIIFTSQNAVQFLLDNSYCKKWIDQIQNIPVVCVGRKTKKLLEINGWNVVYYADYSYDLGKQIQSTYNDDFFLFLSGNIRCDILPNILKSEGISFREEIVYETIETNIKISEHFDIILFYSPSAVRSFLKNNLLDNKVIFSIGHETSKVIGDYPNLYQVSYPSIDLMIKESIRYIEKNNNDK